LAAATRILERLGVRLNPQKTRIVHIQQGFDFLGYRMVRTSGKSKIPRGMIQRWNPKGLIAYPTRKSTRRFRDRVRMLTRRSAQRKTAELIQELNPTLRGWAEYYKRAHVRTLFHKLDGWIVRRIWSHRFCRWRTRGWIQLPKVKLYEEFGLVNLISLIPSLGSPSRSRASSWKLYAGNRHVQFERRTEASATARLLRPDWHRTTTSACQFQKRSALSLLMKMQLLRWSKAKPTGQDTRLERHSYLTRDWMPRTITALPAEVEECSWHPLSKNSFKRESPRPGVQAWRLFFGVIGFVVGGIFPHNTQCLCPRMFDRTSACDRQVGRVDEP